MSRRASRETAVIMGPHVQNATKRRRTIRSSAVKAAVVTTPALGETIDVEPGCAFGTDDRASCKIRPRLLKCFFLIAIVNRGNDVKRLALLFILLGTTANAQTSVVTGKVTHVATGTITYISGDAVYTSLGRNSGIEDSTLVYVMAGKDTVVVLEVFALSSKSSVCSVVKSKRKIQTGDVVFADVPETKPLPEETRNVQPSKDFASVDSQLASRFLDKTTNQQPSESLISLQGRVSVQYFTMRYADQTMNISQPGIILNLRGSVNGSPLKFEVYGNFRSLARGTRSPFAAGSENQTRLYRVSLDYDDGDNQISMGRIIPSAAPSIGYVDGILIARRIGGFVLGSAAGFEPNFTQQGIKTDYRKFAVFSSYQSENPLRLSATAAYARTYFHSQLDREVTSLYLSMNPYSDLSIYAQTDIDLRRKSHDNLLLSPNLTTLYANVNYRITDFFTFGVGAAAWRPTYSFSTIRTLADSLVDGAIRTSPTLSLNFFLPLGLSFYNTYSPRSSNQGLGKEYSNYSSVGISNLFNLGIVLRGSTNINATSSSTTRGYGGSIQKVFLGILDLGIRYQRYRYVVSGVDQKTSTESVATDLMISLTRSMTLWGSVERLHGGSGDGTTILAEISWRF
jgi:hypothetical protein